MHNNKYHITFGKWIKSEVGRTYAIVSGIFSVIYSSIPIAKTFGIDIVSKLHFTTAPDWYAVNFSIQLLFVLFVVLFAAYKYIEFEKPKVVTDNEKTIWEKLRLHRPGTEAPKDEQASIEEWKHFKIASNKVSRQFSSWWFFCWITWLALYILMTINAFSPKDNPVFNSSLINLANNTSSLMFIFLFMTMTVSTSKYGLFHWIRFFIIIFIIFLIDYIATPRLTSAEFWMSLASGLFASFSMAAFFGSINSRTINIPLWVILLLNLYASIQPLYVFFDKNITASIPHVEYLQISVVLLAFLLKVLLFLVVTWILQTGRLTHLVVQESSINFQTDELFKNFLDNSKLREAQLMEQDNSDE